MIDLICFPRASGSARVTAHTLEGVEFLGGSPLFLAHGQVDAFVASAIAQGLTVERRDLEALPLGDTPPDHVATLRQMRGVLVGAEKAAIRWALNRLETLGERLDDIRKIASK